MTDKELYELCKKFGKMTLLARRKFAGLLPEVFKRRLYEKKKFSSIYEFAAKLAGMSRDQVDMVLRLERKFEDKPILQKALIDGEVSANKLIRIASIATRENQEEIFEKVKILSKGAIEVFVKDVKNVQKNEELIRDKNLFQDGSLKPIFGQKVMPGQTLKLEEDIEKELREMQEKGIDVNKFLRNALKDRKEKIEQKKEEISEKQRQKDIENAKISVKQSQKYTNIKISRYVSAEINKIITEEHGTKCSYPGCPKPAKILHHTQRFALTYNHNPQFIAPLCEFHHEIAHKIDLKYVQNSMT
jgi:hypothetical protein